MRLADYLVDRLITEGVERCYLVTGRGSLYLNDAVARRTDLRSVPLHHEQSAAYAAAAESALTGKLSLCMVSTGCASTNTISGVLTAWQDALPVVFISGQHFLNETTHFTGLQIRTYGQQEADIVKVVSPITKYAVMITNPANIAYEIDRALQAATSGRPGPVWLDIPLDLQSAAVEPASLTRFNPPSGLLEPQHSDVDSLHQALLHAERPVFLVGAGSKGVETQALVETLTRTHRIPLVLTASSVDLFDLTEDSVIGAVGAMGCSRAAAMTVQNADLLVVLGSRLNSSITGQDFSDFAREARIFVIDIDEEEHRKNGVRIDRFIHADVKAALGQLAELPLPVRFDAWAETCTRWKVSIRNHEWNPDPEAPIDLYRLADELGKALPADAIVVTDSGLVELIIPTNTLFRGQQRCIHPVSQGAMGYALPAAIGAALASGLPVLVIVGDGSIMMNLQELQSISHLSLPIRILVVNNDAYAVIRKRQKELFRNRTIGTDQTNGVSCPDFGNVARAFGFEYSSIRKSADLKTGLQDLVASIRPTICELSALPDQDYVRMGGFFDASRRYLARPLEDQVPFLPREVLRSEMIVETKNLE